MTTATATGFVTAKDLAQYDLSNYRDPHPSVWATETVLRDEWEIVSYRRELCRAQVGGVTYVATVEQAARPTATACLLHEFSGPVRIGAARDDRSERKALNDLMSHSQWEAERFAVNTHGTRLRPGVLELLASHLGTTSDQELADHLKVTAFMLTLARSGFDPLGGVVCVGTQVIRVLESEGLGDRRFGRSWKLAMERY